MWPKFQSCPWFAKESNSSNRFCATKQKAVAMEALKRNNVFNHKKIRCKNMQYTRQAIPCILLNKGDKNCDIIIGIFLDKNSSNSLLQYFNKLGPAHYFTVKRSINCSTPLIWRYKKIPYPPQLSLFIYSILFLIKSFIGNINSGFSYTTEGVWRKERYKKMMIYIVCDRLYVISYSDRDRNAEGR